ncbi:hypothetical protein RhiirA5_444701 [Rhizophagus irregularis]|uniref:Uncharacterized protein n=1 Tax=Rhizophagus irregularis TaxID=588596 RepID=A0A2N0NCZ2_9GLOM|nr:hypothetical protein RhiirA5_444701 [Rhizophagus irregularis]
MSANPSDLEVFRQRITELEAECKKWSCEVKQELKSEKKTEFENRLAKEERGSSVVDEQPQDVPPEVSLLMHP